MKHLKKIDSFAGRVAERRRLGEDCEAIARYAHQMIVNKRTNSRLRLDVDEACFARLLTAEERAAYARLVAAEWATTQRKTLAAKAVAKNLEEYRAKTKILRTAETERRKSQTEIRRSLLSKGAVAIRDVAQRLGISVAEVQRLHESGRLPSAGSVPIQYSRGKPVHLWLPETIVRYLTGRQ